MIYRRLIPPTGAVATFVLSLALDDASANHWTFALLSAASFVLVVMFGWMRARMGRGTDGRKLTLFGVALRDLWLSLVIYFFVKGTFWAVAAWASWEGARLDRWQVTVLRSSMDAAAALVVGAAFGVAWEMSRARTGPRMVVHVSEPGSAGYDGPDRRSGKDRRAGWGMLL
jgi:hypothetical protein